MRQPPRRNQTSSLSNETRITIVLVLLGMGMLLLILLVGLLLRGYLFPQTAGEAPGGTPQAAILPTSPIPTMSFPTPDCGPPTLILGAATFQIQRVSPGADGSLNIPPDATGAAFWVQGTDVNPLLVLSPAADNLSLLPTLTLGTSATVTWENCNSTTHDLAAPEPGFVNASSLPPQTEDGITVFFQTDSSGNGYVLRGELTGETISVFNLPPASGAEVQAEISLLETTASPDGTSVLVNISIFNYGGTAITLTVNDVTLTPEGSPSFTVTNSEPSLPREIQPGATGNFTLTFPRPITPTATLRIFTVEYDVDGY